MFIVFITHHSQTEVGNRPPASSGPIAPGLGRHSPWTIAVRVIPMCDLILEDADTAGRASSATPGRFHSYLFNREVV